MSKAVRWLLIAACFLFIIIQLFRPDRDNPPVDPSKTLAAVSGIPPNVAALIRNSCFDCHSNESRWPWYSNVAPASWLVAHDVKEGRRRLNFSEWGTYTETKRTFKLEKIQDEVSEGSMPMPKYLLLHPDAKLSEADRKAISDWAATEGERLGGTGSTDQREAGKGKERSE